MVQGNELTRRGLIAGGGAVAVAALVPGHAGAASTVPTWALEPGDAACGTAGCSSCFACQSHAANKLFRSAEAADQGRAHPGCNCTVVSGQPLSQATFDSLFTAGDIADRRTAQTAQFLAAEQEQHAVPMLPVGPAIAVAGGAAAIWWISGRRRSMPA
ncbi:MAG: hypothetical protein HZB15_03370 [Actinobacteria bacterium]|nr:hypothetical protein [Actinomycetota bacterium]